MPDPPFDGKLATHKPLPQGKAFLICEEAELDDITGQFSFFNVVSSLGFPKFPAESPPLAIYLQLYDGIGRYELGIELRNLADDTSVTAENFSSLDFPERLVKMELVLPIDAMRFPRPGRYELVILFEGQELATQFIDAEVSNGSETR
ncbi:MAG TPA: hypothetical protein VNH11_34885 [Pirellulales bacterium]|nr:hypothetical protein [Pirellulales bacterium]